MIGSHVKQLIEQSYTSNIALADDYGIVSSSGQTSGGDYTFNHHNTIKRINLYINDRYMDRNDDAIFWNLSTPRIPHFSKNIDLDTKDLQPYGVGEVNFYQTWILKMKFYRWLQDNQLALTLNDLAEGLSTYGSMVWKRTKVDGKTKLEEVDLQKLFFNPTAKTIRECDVVELHELSETQLRDKAEVWDNVEEVIKAEKKENKGKCNAKVWELWGDCPEKNGKTYFKHVIGYGEGESEVILYEDEDVKREDMPYYDFHLGRYRGRWMRVGVVERLFKLQERVNTLVNQNAQTTEIASLLLLRTKDASVNGNVLEQAESGQIIPSEDLQQIVLQNPGISNFINELNLIERQADKLCLTPEVITGDAMPSGTPFRSLATLGNAAKSAFQFLRQSIGEKLSYILLEDIFPEVVRDWNKGDIFEIAGDEQDIRLYDESLKRFMRWEAYKENLLSGKALTAEQLSVIDAQVEQEIETIGRRIEVPKNYFNFEFGIRLNVTGEQVDKQQKNDAAFNAIQMVASNPAIANIPQFKQYVEENGLTHWKLTPEQVAEVKAGATGAQPIDKPKTDALMSQVNS